MKGDVVVVHTTSRIRITCASNVTESGEVLLPTCGTGWTSFWYFWNKNACRLVSMSSWLAPVATEERQNHMMWENFLSGKEALKPLC